jgi:glycosyltransferase involved in cell wall biosynthesis
MKIVHIIARFNVGGTATWIDNLSQSLNAAGNESYILAGYVQEGEEEDSRFLECGGIRVSNLGRKVSLFSDFKAFFEIRKRLVEIAPDVVNTHTAKAGVVGRLATLSLGRNRPAIVHTIHGHLFRGYFNRLGVYIVNLIESNLSRITDVMLFAGEKVKEDCLHRGIVFQKSSKVVMPGVKVQPSEVISSEKITIGWLARFAQVKRPDRVIELAHKYPDISFYLGGDGPLRSTIEHSAPSNCHFVGWTKPEEFWPKCTIALLTSENEALPISLIEAQMYGLPCVATPAGSTIEVVIDKENGFMAKNFEVESLYEGLDKLINNQSLRKLLGARGKERSTELFSISRQLHDHIEAYKLAISIRMN